MRFKRGERVYFSERPWAVLESDKKRVLVVDLMSGCVEQLPASKQLKRTGKVHSALIREVNLHLENLDVGGRILLESEPREVVLKCANGDFWVKDSQGARSKIPKRKVEAFVAKSLIERSRESRRSKRTTPASPLAS